MFPLIPSVNTLISYLYLVRFCEEDIDQILERRTQVVVLESQGKGSTFAKVLISPWYGELLIII